MAHYLDPKNDLVFKRIFGEHPDLLISFLNALMPLPPGRQIESVEYLPAELVPNNPAKKDSIVDVRCKDNCGRQFLVEMQMYWSRAFLSRLVFNTSKAYVKQLDKGDHYELLQPVYGLGILNENFDSVTPEFYHHYQTVNRGNTDEVIEGLEFVLVELPKFEPEKWADRKMAVLWLRFLKEIKEQTREAPADLLANEYIHKAVDICEEGRFTEAELAHYEYYLDYIRTERAYLYASYVDGQVKGKAEGRVEGEVEGERKKAIQVVKESAKAGIPVETIAVITGLTPEEVSAILNSES
jgi:predicted transposase/invertase (TIGR01784 family)